MVPDKNDKNIARKFIGNHIVDNIAMLCSCAIIFVGVDKGFYMEGRATNSFHEEQQQ